LHKQFLLLELWAIGSAGDPERRSCLFAFPGLPRLTSIKTAMDPTEASPPSVFQDNDLSIAAKRVTNKARDQFSGTTEGNES